MSTDLTKLDDEMMSALLDWRQRAGRSWKEKLQIGMTGADENDPRGSALRAYPQSLSAHPGSTGCDRVTSMPPPRDGG